ncbi:MAG: hypothetical protein KKF00_01445 [Proteobacteria bacterium]|nr:hypothetical protein [Pseudomonadota bacterium]
MKIELQSLERKAESTLKQCLDKVPFVQITDIQKEPRAVGAQIDFTVEMTAYGMKQLLAVEVKRTGQPKAAREAINSLLRWLSLNAGAYGVFIAPYISSQTAEICWQEGVGYCDFAGNCLLTFGGVYIEKSGNPNPFSEKRELRSLYSPKAARILRVILNNPRKNRKMQDLAREAEVSLGQAANVKKLLDSRELIEKAEKGFTLQEPYSLLSEWSRYYAFRKNRTRDFYSLRSIPDIEAEITDVCKRNKINYAFTGFSGAARLKLAVRYQRVMAYVDAEEDQLIKLFEFKEVSSGANVTLLMPYDDGVFYGATTKEGSRVVSPVQLYLDLIGFKGRGEEAAKALLEEVIKPLW